MPQPIDHPPNGTVTRRDLADRLYGLGFSRRDSQALVTTLFELISDALAEGEAVKLSGFGKFETVERAARAGRNPRTGGRLELDGRRSVAFRPSRRLREELTDALPWPEETP